MVCAAKAQGESTPGEGRDKHGMGHLSEAETRENPCEQAEQRYLVGQVVDSRTTRVAPFGAFASPEPGLEGFIPALNSYPG